MNTLKKILVGLCCAGLSFSAQAAAYSFEEATVPAAWNSVASGVLSVSDVRYKLEAKSLRWDWSAGSVLTVANPDNLSYSTANSTRASSSGVDGWVYNENPSTSKLIFEFYNASNVKKCSIEFNLNFRGWRRLCVRYYEDLRYDRTPLQNMKVVAPASGSGVIYFDAFEFSSNVTWERISDMQYEVRANVNDPDIDNFLRSRNTTKPALPASVSATELAAYTTIVNRFEDWYFGTNKYSANPYYLSRSNALNRTSGSTYISRARTKMTSFPLVAGGDGIVTNKGLYATAQTAINGITVDIFRTYSEQYLLPLAYDYRLNSKTDSRDYLLKMFDWYNNQGWADGSALGVLRFEKLRSGGYFHSVFLMRDAMSTEQRAREVETVYWYSLFGDCYKTPEYLGETADNLRTLALPKLMYALMQTDNKERARALQWYSKYMNNALSISPGYLGTFKNDYSGYHHRAAYASSYAPDALNMGCLIYYLLYDTPYQLSPEVYKVLKGSLLEYYDFISAGYDVPQALKGRFPDAGPVQHTLMPAMALLALANTEVDADLAGALKRLWMPDVEPVKSWLSSVNTDITFTNTPGAIESILDAMNNSIPALPKQQGSKYFPYAGTMVSKSGNWHTNIKGFSKYIWDFEGGSNENLYGRYTSNGTVQILNPELNINSHQVGNADWDWARFPGATAKYLPKASLDFGGTTHRNFSDQAFLGGVSVDSIGFISMQLHDNTFDQSFYANKSVFIFGKNSYHIGSNIRCSDVNNGIETTLFQSLRSAGSAKINGQTISAGIGNEPNPTLQDSYGNTFVVHSGAVNISLNSTFATAVINHGKQPSSGSYQYSQLPGASSAEAAKMKNAETRPVQLIQANDTAHIIYHKELNTVAYALFRAGKVGYGIVDSVNTPCIILVKQFGDSACQISFSDPDMRKKTASRNDNLSFANAAVPSDSFDIAIRLNHSLIPAESAGTIKVDTTYNTTMVRARVTEGQNYHITLVRAKSITPIDTTDNPITGVTKEKGVGISIYPNPAAGVLYVDGVVQNSASVKIYNIGGQLLKTQEANGSHIVLNLSFLPKGIYFVSVVANGKTLVTKQIIKQ